MSIKAYFNATRDSAEGIKQEFLAQVDDAFEGCISDLEAHEGDEAVPPGVTFETDADIQAMKTETEYFISGKFDHYGVVIAE